MSTKFTKICQNCGKEYIKKSHVSNSIWLSVSKFCSYHCLNKDKKISYRGALNRKRDGTSSKYKGVNWNKRAGVWYARLRPHGEDIYLGSFYDEKLAALAYNKKAREVYGELAYQNDLLK